MKSNFLPLFSPRVVSLNEFYIYFISGHVILHSCILLCECRCIFPITFNLRSYPLRHTDTQSILIHYGSISSYIYVTTKPVTPALSTTNQRCPQATQPTVWTLSKWCTIAIYSVQFSLVHHWIYVPCAFFTQYLPFFMLLHYFLVNPMLIRRMRINNEMIAHKHNG